MKKTLLLLLVMSVATGVVVGCHSDDAVDAPKVTTTKNPNSADPNGPKLSGAVGQGQAGGAAASTQ